MKPVLCAALISLFLAAAPGETKVNVKIGENATLEAASIDGTKVNFTHSKEVKDTLSVTLPAEGKEIQLSGKTKDGRKFSVTGVGFEPKTAVLFDLSSILTRGAEVHVTSNPSGADVFFNDKEYHLKTNIKSARDPGPWKVTLKKEGYKDFESTHTLEDGEVWALSVKMEKK
jgi:hypothetical protein